MITLALKTLAVLLALTPLVAGALLYAISATTSVAIVSWQGFAILGLIFAAPLTIAFGLWMLANKLKA